MYGLINMSVKELVIEQFGAEKWQRVVERAGLADDVFISNKPYDDQITYNLVKASAEVLQMDPEAVLHAFGRYWVLSVAPKGYGKLLDAGGSTLEDFLLNLPNFHSRIMLIFPFVKPPHFESVKMPDGRLRLTYGSGRPGLLPFVSGLLEGLAERFAVKVKIEYAGAGAVPGTHQFFIEKV